MNKEISVVLGTYNRKRYLKLCIDSVRKELSQLRFSCEIIVVDGGSTDGTIKWLTGQKDIISIIQHNHGKWNGIGLEKRSWGYFMNLGFKCAKGKYICMVSDDCLIVPESIKNGYELVESKTGNGEKIGGAAFYWRDIPGPDKYWVGELFNCTYLINHGLFVKSVLEELGYIDEQGFKFYYADSDLCLRINQAGYKILLSEKSFVEHYSHANYKNRVQNSMNANNDKEKFMERWESEILLKNPDYDKNKTIIEYADKYHTAKGFRKVMRLNYYEYKKQAKNIIRKIIK